MFQGCAGLEQAWEAALCVPSLLPKVFELLLGFLLQLEELLCVAGYMVYLELSSINMHYSDSIEWQATSTEVIVRSKRLGKQQKRSCFLTKFRDKDLSRSGKKLSIRERNYWGQRILPV